MIAQLEAGKALVDQAATASDRWLFLAALGIIIVGGVTCINWLVKSLGKKDADHATAFEKLNAEHLKERAEWRIAEGEAKEGFLTALKEQRTDLRAELSLERDATAKMAAIVEKLAGQLAASTPVISPHMELNR